MKTPPEGFVFVDWKDNSGYVWQDCMLESQLVLLKKDVRATILKVVRGGAQ